MHNLPPPRPPGLAAVSLGGEPSSATLMSERIYTTIPIDMFGFRDLGPQNCWKMWKRDENGKLVLREHARLRLTGNNTSQPSGTVHNTVFNCILP